MDQKRGGVSIRNPYCVLAIRPVLLGWLGWLGWPGTTTTTTTITTTTDREGGINTKPVLAIRLVLAVGRRLAGGWPAVGRLAGGWAVGSRILKLMLVIVQTLRAFKNSGSNNSSVKK